MPLAIVTGSSNVGGLLGSSSSSSSSSSITNSYATGSVTGNSDVGGLVGDNDIFGRLGLDNSGVAPDIVLFAIRRSYATGSVSGNRQVGGLVGRSFVSGEGGHFRTAGGPGGDARFLIIDSYAAGETLTATGSDPRNIGGLVGINHGERGYTERGNSGGKALIEIKEATLW